MGSAPITELAEDGVAYIDGAFGPVSEAKISILDWGFNRSDVTYDVVAVTDGAFFRLPDHLERFDRAMKELHLDPGLARGQIRAVLHGCVALSGLRDAYVEMLCTRGKPARDNRDLRDARNVFAAYAIPYVSIAGGGDRHEGLDAVIATSVERIRPEAVDPTVKNFHWGDLVRGLFEAYDRGAETVILTDGAGNVTEGPGFNVFAVEAGVVLTPAGGVLLGITRRTVFDICTEVGILRQEGSLSSEMLRAADEVFFTSTAGGIVPVTRLDGKPVGSGRMGKVTGSIQRAYWQRHADPRWTESVDYGAAPAFGDWTPD